MVLRRILMAAVILMAGKNVVAQVEFQRTNPAFLRTSFPLPKVMSAVVPPASIVDDLLRREYQRIVVPAPEGDFTIEGNTFSLFTNDAVMVKRTERGDEYTDIPHHALFRGTLQGIPGSHVFLAAFTTHVVGIIEINEPEGKRRFLISPDTIVDGRMAQHVVYEVKPGMGTPRDCHAEELPNYYRQADSIFAIVNRDERMKGAGDATQDATTYSLQLALDCTLSFYKNLGSSITTAASSAIAIAGACSAVYQRDASVVLRVPYLRVWTVTDPYPGDIGAKLGAVRDHWENNMKHVRRSTTCLLSGEGGGGLAWVGVMCGGYGYNVSGVDGRVNFPAGGYIWDIDVTSHELGHNIGSSHTHNCGWNPPIDSCYNAEGGCYEATRPRRGTIMSYCHLTNKGTELQFHPRVGTLFRRVLSTTWCNASIPTRKDTDVAVVAINIPLNGAEQVAKKSFQPSAYVRNLGDKGLTNVSVVCEITDITNALKKSITTMIPQISSGQTTLVQFSAVTLDSIGSYLIRVTAKADKDQYGSNDLMTRPFNVVSADSGSITILSPNGGEKLIAGTTAAVQFSAKSVKNVHLQYSVDDGATWTTLQYSVDGAAGTVNWNVPFIASSQCLVRAMSLTNSNIVDVSNGRFTIEIPLDVQAFDIVTPDIKDPQTTPVTPRLVVRNLGRQDAIDVRINFSMKWVRATAPSVDTTFTLPVLKAQSQDTIVLNATPVLADGVHTMEFYVNAVGDTNKTNDRMWREFTAKGLTPPSDVRYEEGPNRVLLQWQLRAFDAAARVELWRGQSPATMQKVRTLRPTVTTYVDDGLTNDSTYVYGLRVIKGNLVSVFTSLVYARPQYFPGASAPAVPAVISPVDGSMGVPALADLVWTSVNGGDQYEVQVALDNAFQDLEYVGVVRDPGMLTLPLDFNSTRRWRVRALNQSVTGIWSKSATFATTKNCAGKGLAFNGNGDKATDATLTWNGGPVTVEYWTYVKRSTLKASTTFMVGETDNGANRFQSHAPWDDGRIYWDYGNLNDKGRISAPLGDANFDRWTHIALVSDGATFKAIYINGEEVASAKEASSPTGLKELTIGGMRSNTWFNGMVDEFRIWNVARSAEDIRANMNRRMPQASDNSKVVGWWRLDEGTGNSSKDAVRARVLNLNSATMWTNSDALVSCDDPAELPAPSIVSGSGVAPAIRTHVHEISWSPVVQSRGTTWYEVRVLDTTSSSLLQRINNVPSNGANNVVVGLRGLPADTTVRIRVKAHNTYGDSPWTSFLVTTQTPCALNTVTFVGNADRFTSEKFAFKGKAATVEYWSLVDTTQLINSVAFSVGDKDDIAHRMQAHGPWGDKNYYWDYGDLRESGRISTSYEKNINKWTHVALVSNGYDSMAIYFNGTLARRSAFAESPGSLQQLFIGGNPYQNTWFKGVLRDFRIWNTMRSEQQIRNSMYDHIIDARPNLLGSWLLDEGRGLRANDALSMRTYAKSEIELAWGTSRKLNQLQSPAVVYGRREVRRGDTATYILREVIDARYNWQVQGGTIVSGDNTNEVVVRWNSTDTAGVIIIRRQWPGGCEDQTTLPVSLPVVVGVTDFTEPLHSFVTPNPAFDAIYVHSDQSAQLEIIDLQGRLVMHQNVDTGVTTVPIDAMAQGSYIVRLLGADGTQTRRLSVQR